MKLQRGGTLLGFILGVVVGLGLALGVAMYVTKVPVPFMNKGQSRTPEQDEQEARKNKDWDPNAGLYGKNPARPASTPTEAAPKPDTKAAEAKTDGKPDAKAEAKVGAKPEAKTDAKTDAKPPAKDALGDLAKAKAGASADPFIYFVQTGAYRTPEDAEAQRAKLLLLGVDAKVSERDQSGHMVYRVRVGPFDAREDADRAKDKLDSNHQDAVLVRVQR